MPWTDGFGTFNRLYDWATKLIGRDARRERRINDIRREIKVCVYETHDVVRLRQLRTELDRLLDDVRRRDPECEKEIVRPPDVDFIRTWAPSADVGDILISGDCYLRRVDDTIEILHLRSVRTP